MAVEPTRGQLPLRLSALLVAPMLLLLCWSFFLPIGRLLLTSVTEPSLSLDNYHRLVTQPLYTQVIVRTLWIALSCTILALLLGEPECPLSVNQSSTIE